MGIIIPAAASFESPEAKNQVEWEKESTEDKTGAIYSGKNSFKSGEGEFTVAHQGDSFAGSHAYLLLTDVPGEKANSGATITSKDSSGHQAFVATETRGTTEQEAAVGAGTELKTLLKQDGKSEFLQLVTLAKRKVNFGSVKVKMEKEKKESAVVEVSHGLGVTPASIQLTIEKSAPENNQLTPRVVAGSPTTSVFKVFFNSSIAFGAMEEIPIYWTAFG